MAGKAKRNEKKCKAYRAKIGKPRGPGVAGNKSGKGYAARGITRAKKTVKKG